MYKSTATNNAIPQTNIIGHKTMETVAIFVDVQNIYYTVKQRYNCHYDYNAFWEQATRGRKLVKAIAYATNKDDEKQLRFQKILKQVGFAERLKP